MDPQRLAVYTGLIRAFLGHSISVTTFERRFLDAFKSEAAAIEPAVYAVLQELFSDVDAYDPTCQPGAESDFVISEARLRERARAALAALEPQMVTLPSGV